MRRVGRDQAASARGDGGGERARHVADAGAGVGQQDADDGIAREDADEPPRALEHDVEASLLARVGQAAHVGLGEVTARGGVAARADEDVLGLADAPLEIAGNGIDRDHVAGLHVRGSRRVGNPSNAGGAVRSTLSLS